MFSGNHKDRSGAGQREVHLQSAHSVTVLLTGSQHSEGNQMRHIFQSDFFEHLFHSGRHVLC